MSKCNKVTKWINYNRFLVIGITVAIAMWLFLSCGTPTTESPYREGVMLTADELETEYYAWINDQNTIARGFIEAGKDLERQQQAQNEVKKLIIDLANGDVTDVKSTLLLFAMGGGGGAIIDNIRKRGLISGQKNALKAWATNDKTETKT